MNLSLECLNDQMWDFLVYMWFSVSLNVLGFSISHAKQRPVSSGHREFQFLLMFKRHSE